MRVWDVEAQRYIRGTHVQRRQSTPYLPVAITGATFAALPAAARGLYQYAGPVSRLVGNAVKRKFSEWANNYGSRQAPKKASTRDIRENKMSRAKKRNASSQAATGSKRGYTSKRKSRRTSKRRNKSCSVKDMCKTVAKLKRSVTAINKKANLSLGNYEVRSRLTGVIREDSFGKAGYIQLTVNSKNEWAALLADVPVYDEETAAFVTQNYVLDQSINMQLKSVWAQLALRNNAYYRQNLTIYTVAPREDTIHSPSDLIEAGYADIGISPADVTNLQANFSDSKPFRKDWKVVKMTKVSLEPGQMHEEKAYAGECKWDYTYIQGESNYNRDLKTLVFVVRVETSIGHKGNEAVNSFDSANTATAAIDFILERRYRMQYNGGGSFHRVKTIDVTPDDFPLITRQSATTSVTLAVP